MFADVHSHVLYGIDDGARDATETRSLLKHLSLGGTTHLALTPHYYPYRRSVASFLEKRERAYKALKDLPEAEHFRFSLGAEVFLSETLLNNEDLCELCYAGTRYMLTELDCDAYFTDAARYRLLRLIDEFGVTPVLAHIDRYDFLRKDMGLLRELKKMGCLFQVNLSALQGFFTRKQVQRLVESGYVDFFGEDAHRSVLDPGKKQRLLSAAEKGRPDFVRLASRQAISRLFVR